MTPRAKSSPTQWISDMPTALSCLPLQKTRLFMASRSYQAPSQMPLHPIWKLLPIYRIFLNCGTSLVHLLLDTPASWPQAVQGWTSQILQRLPSHQHHVGHPCPRLHGYLLHDQPWPFGHRALNNGLSKSLCVDSPSTMYHLQG